LKILFTLILTLTALLHWSCQKYKVTPPAYLVIDSVRIKTNYATQGTTSQNIKNISLAINGTEYGLYEIPCKIPLKNLGEAKTMVIRPYIKESGQGDFKFNYLYMNNYTQTLNIQQEQVIRVTPEFTYTSFAKFKWLEDFENSALSISKSNASKADIDFEINSNKVFEGNKCGKINLNSTKDYFVGTTIKPYDLPTSGDYSYLEMNYTNTCRFAVGLEFTEKNTVQYVLALTLTPTTNANTKATWNKVYINYAGILAEHKTATNFKFYIYAQRDTTHTTDEILLDNLKMVTN
jgi:hypothetical protein